MFDKQALLKYLRSIEFSKKLAQYAYDLDINESVEPFYEIMTNGKASITIEMDDRLNIHVSPAIALSISKDEPVGIPVELPKLSEPTIKKPVKKPTR